MTTHASFPELSLINGLSRDASTLGYEIVDLAGFLDLVDQQGQMQRQAIAEMQRVTENVERANGLMGRASGALQGSIDQTFADVQASVGQIRAMGDDTRSVAEWVQTLSTRTGEVSQTLVAVKKNNSQIDSIALQVNTLAINAKIEAARAGDAGRGFAVVAEAINELSRQTKDAAEQISANIDNLTAWIDRLSGDTKTVSKQAESVLAKADATDDALVRMEASVQQAKTDTGHITEQTKTVSDALQMFVPNQRSLSEAVETTSNGIIEARQRIERLVDTSEAMVQASASLGGTTEDAPFIEFVQSQARSLSDALEAAVIDGRITEADLFMRQYTPIPGSDPEQVVAPFTELFDEIMPPIQEPALDFDDKVVFCAAVDQNGYLPTHNRKFSHPQSADPVWNVANCRNRRIFDDRVGLKAGRSVEPFLLQVYRRDMGGGTFKMMKDLSAPIFVKEKHWGGLRFAYTF